MALSDGSPDGMDALRTVASCASELLRDGGFLAVEVCFSPLVLFCPLYLLECLTTTASFNTVWNYADAWR